MAREAPGSGAVIEPIFDEIFGVRAVNVKEGGSGYDPDPPRLTTLTDVELQMLRHFYIRLLMKILVKLFTLEFLKEVEDMIL